MNGRRCRLLLSSMVTLFLVLLVLATTISVEFFGVYCLQYLRNIQNKDVDVVLQIMQDVIGNAGKSSTVQSMDVESNESIAKSKSKDVRLEVVMQPTGELSSNHQLLQSLTTAANLSLFISNRNDPSFISSSSTSVIVEFSHDYAEGQFHLQMDDVLVKLSQSQLRLR